MFELFGKRFLQAVHQEASRALGPEHPCAVAAARAAETGEKSDIDAAQNALSSLPGDVSERLLASVHKTMREDPEALLAQWGAPGDPSRTN